MKVKLLFLIEILMFQMLTFAYSQCDNRVNSSEKCDVEHLEQCCHVEQYCQRDSSKYTLGVNFGVPFFWGDMLSFADEKSYIGYNVGLSGSYRISDLLQTSLLVDYSSVKLGSRDYSNRYYVNDSGLIHYSSSDGFLQLKELYSDVSAISLGVSLDLNLNSLYDRNVLDDKFSVWLSPTMYLHYFDYDVCKKTDDSSFITGNELSFGLGGAVTMQYKLSEKLDLVLRNSIIWICNNDFEGVKLQVDNSRQSAAWKPQLGLNFRF